MKEKTKISRWSIAAVIVSSVSLIAFALLFEAEGAPKAIVRFIWAVSGLCSLVFPTIAKYYRKKRGTSGKALETAALILGFFGCDTVLIYALQLKWNIDIVIAISLCVLYMMLFNNVTQEKTEELDALQIDSQSQPEDGNMLKCKKCGKYISKESIYCQYCGKKVQYRSGKKTVPMLIFLFTLISSIAIAGVCSVYFLFHYQSGIAAMDSQNFITASYHLSKIPYCDRLLPDECAYISAGLLIEDGKYMDAFNAFNDLDSPVPASVLEYLKDKIYCHAQKNYRNKSFIEASKEFRAIGDYKRSEDYQFLIRCRRGSYYADYYKLFNLIGFEDANDVILNDNDFFKLFLKGEWRDSKNSKYFKITNDGKCSHNLPCTYVSGGYYYLNKGFYSESNGSGSTTRQFKFSIIDKNTVSVFCYKDSQNYKLLRQ